MPDNKLTEPVGNSNRLTDTEIIKALECCSKSNTDDNYCTGCPYEFIKNCASKISKDNLDLINRQNAEIERLKSVLPERGGVYTVVVGNAVVYTKSTEYYDLFMKNIFAKAYKEFADKVKAKFPSYNEPYQYWEIHEELDNLLKELVGEE